MSVSEAIYDHSIPVNLSQSIVLTLHDDALSSLLFNNAFYGKKILNDSITRTSRGWEQIKDRSIIYGCVNITFARIESITSFAMVSFSSILLTCFSAIFTPLFLLPIAPLNLGSRLPGISYFTFANRFNKWSSEIIKRICRVHLIAVPVLILFLSASIINIIPGVFKAQKVAADKVVNGNNEKFVVKENFLFRSIHHLVKPLGELKYIKGVIIDENGKKRSLVGAEKETLSPLSVFEEYFRALSYKNYLKEVKANKVYLYTQRMQHYPL